MDKKKITSIEETLNTSNKGKAYLKRLTIGAVAALVITNSTNLGTDVVKADQVYETWEDGGVFVPFNQETEVVEENTGEIIEDIEETDVVETMDIEQEEVITSKKIQSASEVAAKYDIKNFGDPADDSQVAEKAQLVINYFEQTGVINSYTYEPYTVKEVSDIIKYMNGTYVPESQEDAFYIVDRFLEFTCGPLSSVPTVDMINYMADSEVITKEIIESEFEQYEQIDWTNALLMGDSYCYPYLEWFSSKFNEMMRTTDKDLFKSIYNELTQSLADICYGKGYEINGAIYNVDDFHGLNRINDGSLLHFFGLLYQIGYVNGVQTEYTIDTVASGKALVHIDDILRLLNVECAEDLAAHAEYNTDGYVIYPVNDNLDNPFMRWETDTINKSLENARDKQLSLSK